MIFWIMHFKIYNVHVTDMSTTIDSGKDLSQLNLDERWKTGNFLFSS